MKKLLSFFILLLTFTAGCTYSTFADFLDVENKMEMQHEMMQDDCHHMQMEDCESSNNMDCCKSPFNVAIIQNFEFDEELFNNLQDDIDIWIIETFAKSINKYHQLNSPPDYNQCIHAKSEYIYLVWSVKSNC